MNALTAATHAHHVNPRTVVLVAELAAAYLLVLWARAKFLRSRAYRTAARTFAPGTSRRRTGARAEHRMVTRSASSRQATRQFRKAAFIAALIFAVWLFAQLHPHTH
jgi:hypothetical protein